MRLSSRRSPLVQVGVTALILCAVLIAITVLTSFAGDRVFARVVTVMLISVVLAVALQIFMGNSGLSSFGHIAFIASVVGGMENLKGAVLGGYLLGFLTVGLQTWLPQAMLDYRNAILFGIVIVILLLRPEGLIRPAYSRERR